MSLSLHLIPVHFPLFRHIQPTHAYWFLTSPPRRGSESYTRIGRGGAANVFMPNTEGFSVGVQESSQCEIMVEQMPAKVNMREEDKDVMGLADKGKEWLLSRCRRATSDNG